MIGRRKQENVGGGFHWKQGREEGAMNNAKDIWKILKKHTILYLPKIIYNTYKCRQTDRQMNLNKVMALGMTVFSLRTIDHLTESQ